MALQRGSIARTGLAGHELLGVLLGAVALIVLMVVLSIVFGNVTPSPSWELVPDPAGIEIPF